MITEADTGKLVQRLNCKSHIAIRVTQVSGPTFVGVVEGDPTGVSWRSLCVEFGVVDKESTIDGCE